MTESGNSGQKAAIYCRVSTTEQSSEGTSLTFQQAQLKAYCQLQGWILVDTFTDPGFSGKDADRPGLKRLMAVAKAGLFDRVVVYKLDRLARSLPVLLGIEQELRDHGVTLVFMKDPIDTSSATGKLVFQVLGAVAELERENIVERTRNGKLERYRGGCWAGGKPPYGYSHDKDTRKLVVNEGEARIVRRMYEEYADGRTLFGIAQGLNRDGVPPRSKKGRGWWQAGVRQVLLNPVYKGTELVNRHGHISLINKMDLSAAISVSVSPLVGEQVWQTAQNRMQGNRRVRPSKQGAFLLQGMMTCGTCGLGFAAKRANRDYRYYMCRGRMNHLQPGGLARRSAPYLNAKWLEDEVWRRFEDILNDPNKLMNVIEESVRNLREAEADLSARVRPIDDRLADIADQKERLADDWIVRHVNRQKFNELREGLDREEARMKALKAGIDPAQIEALESTRATLAFWESQVRAMAWNTENEDGTMIRLADGPHRVALKLVGFEDVDLSKSAGFPTSRRQLPDKLQTRLSVFDDRVEVKALFPVEAVGVQSCTSARRRGTGGR